MSQIESDNPDRAVQLETFALDLDYSFTNIDLLELAFRHRSWCSEHGATESNERLEFLGDAVLQLVVTEHLYRYFANEAEGVLAKQRAAVVSSRALAVVARRLGLSEMLRLGRGEECSGGREKDSILADCTEAVFGAVYLDSDFAAAAEVVELVLEPELAWLRSGADPGDPKSRLQESTAADMDVVPKYEIEETGPDHSKVFTATVILGQDAWGHGEGRTKKEAEQEAAAMALTRLAHEGKIHS